MATTTIKTKRDACRLLIDTCGHNSPELFLANVLLTGCSQKALRVKGLAMLVEAGFQVRMAEFQMFRIIVDGFEVEWDLLLDVARGRVQRCEVCGRMLVPQKNNPNVLMHAEVGCPLA